MAHDFVLSFDGAEFGVTGRPVAQGGSAVVFEIVRLTSKPARIGQIHRGDDGAYVPAAFDDDAARRTLEALIPLLQVTLR
jgi:hypothetical protein